MLCDGCVTALDGECPDFCPFFGIRQDYGTPVCVQEILELGFASLRSDDFRMAVRYFGRVLSYDSKNGRALLGMLIASAEAHGENELAEILKENMQQDNAIFQHILRKTMEFAPDEIRGVFSDDYYDACKLMKAGKYKKALRIFRAIKDYHSDASDMADECLRLLAIDITGALKSSVPLEKKEIAIDPEILSIRHELQAMIDRYVGAVDEKSSEYIFAVNASHLERYMKLSYSDHILSDKIRKLKFLNDARSILRMTREFLERIFSDHARMIRRAARGNHDSARRFPILAEFNFVKLNVNGLFAIIHQARSERVSESLWLLVDFFEHKVRVSALFRARHIPLDMRRLANHFVSFRIEQINMVVVEDGDFILIEIVHIARVFKNGRNIARNEVLALAQADDERAFLSGGNHSVGVFRADHTERVASFKPVQSLQNGFKNLARLFVEIIEQVRDDFGVSLAFEHHALVLKPRLELCVVFDDSVMNDSDCSRNIRVRMRIQIARLAVSCPARMPDTDSSPYDFARFFNQFSEPFFRFRIAHVFRFFYDFISDSFNKKFERTLRLFDQDFIARVRKNGNSRRVVAAIFKFFKTIDKNRCRLL